MKTAFMRIAVMMALFPLAHPAQSADITDLDQCREQINELDRTGTPVIASTGHAALFKTMLVDVWLQCRDGKFDSANAGFGQVQALLTKASGE